MPQCNLALLGFGNVGQALAQLLLKKRQELRRKYNLTFSVTGIATGSHGRAIHPVGIDLERALSLIQEGESLDSLSPQPAPQDNLDFIRRCPADVLFENTPVNYETGQPAVDHLRAALENGMHAITANKGPVVHAYRQLRELAQAKGLKFFFEATVMDGAPVFALYREALPGAEIKSFRGILNSTTNLILSRMESGDSFEKVVRYAQDIGLAETDPSGDIDGWDAAVKVAALATVVMGTPLKPQDVDRQGIRQIDTLQVASAKSQNKRWKLVCSATRQGDRIQARVAPEMVSVDSPLYGVTGTSSMVQFESDVLGLLSIIEEDPGPQTTAYGLFADFLNAVRAE
jgi:homoserine dehydrogenase